MGYFKELDEEAQNHELMAFLAQLGKGKGVISPHFILKGLEVIVHFNQIQMLLNQGKISQNDIDNALKYFDYNKNYS